MIKYIIPLLILLIFIYAFFKKVDVYSSFTMGVKEAIALLFDILPYLISIFLMTELFEVSGLSSKLIEFLSPLFSIFGIPKEVCKLVILKPFSGSGSLALVTELFNNYGVDSYIARCGSIIFGSSETVFYISAVYYAKVKDKRVLKPIIISLISTFISTVVACFICLFI